MLKKYFGFSEITVNGSNISCVVINSADTELKTDLAVKEITLDSQSKSYFLYP